MKHARDFSIISGRLLKRVHNLMGRDDSPFHESQVGKKYRKRRRKDTPGGEIKKNREGGRKKVGD